MIRRIFRGIFFVLTELLTDLSDALGAGARWLRRNMGTHYEGGGIPEPGPVEGPTLEDYERGRPLWWDDIHPSTVLTRQEWEKLQELMDETTPEDEPEHPEPADIEILDPSDPTSNGVIVPRELRINGHPVLASGDHPVTLHELPMDGSEVVRVTLTLFARRIYVGHKGQA